ncbi:MAG TPA: hypothetical protein PKK26_11385 [Candidatus Wallbacteria bacterium]|nr:hypothetical protein [Candidatus Wallbacteria bacterium]
MKDLISIRADIGGTVEFFQIKLNKIKKVMLPGGMIFITNRDNKDNSVKISFAKPVKYVLKSKLATVFHCQHGDEIEEKGDLVSIFSEIEGVVSIKKNKIVVSKKSITKEYDLDKCFEILVEEGASVKIGQQLARVRSTFYGIVKYNFAVSENEKDRIKKVESVEILKNAVAYEMPDDFLIKVANGAVVKEGAIIAEGVIREDSYGDISIEKESFEEEKDDEEEVAGAEEEVEEAEEESPDDFNYDEEAVDSEFDDEAEQAPPPDDEDYQPSKRKKAK